MGSQLPATSPHCGEKGLGQIMAKNSSKGASQVEDTGSDLGEMLSIDELEAQYNELKTESGVKAKAAKPPRAPRAPKAPAEPKPTKTVEELAHYDSANPSRTAVHILAVVAARRVAAGQDIEGAVRDVANDYIRLAIQALQAQPAGTRATTHVPAWFAAQFPHLAVKSKSSKTDDGEQSALDEALS